MSKQTAVNWLIDQLEEWGKGRIKWPQYLWDEAVDLETEQIVRAFHAGCKDEYAVEEVRDWAVDYYNDTYRKRNTPISEGVDQPGLPEGRN